MPILLEKILTLLFAPLGIMFGTAILALILLTIGRRRGAILILMFLVAWGWVWSTPFLGSVLLGRLVDGDHYPPHYAEELPAGDAVVVLGGGVLPVSGALVYPDLTYAADRIWHAARLYHAGKAPLIIASGGNVWPGPQQQSEADAIRAVLNAFGVPDDVIITESSSRNTRQNAALTAKIATKRGIKRVLLVTSLLHMRRAEAAFERVGLDVIPAAVDFTRRRSNFRSPWILKILPSTFSLHINTSLLREHLGHLVYRIKGLGLSESGPGI